MRRVGKGFSRVETPPFEGMIVVQQPDNVADEGAAGVDVDVVPAAAAEPSIPSPTPTTQPPPPSQELPSTSQVIPTPPLSPIVAQALEIIKLKQRVKKLERKNKLKVSGLKRLRNVRTAQRVESFKDTDMNHQEDASKQEEIIANIDADEDVTLKDVAAVEKMLRLKRDDELKPAELKEVVTTAKLMTKLVTSASATITAATTPITAATITAAPSAARRRKGVVIKDPKETATPSIIIHSKLKSKDKGKWIMVKEPKPQKKQAHIEQDEAYTRELKAELNKNINWDDVIEQVQRKEKEDNAMMRNMTCFKMDYFKGMSYDNIRLIFKKYFNSNVAFLEKTKEQLEEEENKALKRKTESFEEKAAKKKKLDEEVEELKKHLQMVPNNDDVYTEATPLALKVPVVDYVIYTENNKPYFKIIRADGSHQLFLSFLSLLRNFDREELEVLWQLVKETFASSKPKNFSDDFMLTTLTYMFEKPDI
uniref:Uncharacterized protein n=1 Tax=Tanacetum cinerariifolium TaxID=118510 RepID=A0A6L2LT87_TANCI|nr:hypothetical protein [Tanacetum cinerariifolium]